MYIVSIFVLSSASLTNTEEQWVLWSGAIVCLLHWLHFLPEDLLPLNINPMVTAWDLHLQQTLFLPPTTDSYIQLALSHGFQMFTTVYRPIAFQDPLHSQASLHKPAFAHLLHLALIDKIFVLFFSTSSSLSLRNSTFDVPSSGNVLPLLFYLKCPLFRKVSLLNTLKWPSALSSSLHLILWCITHILPLVSPLE